MSGATLCTCGHGGDRHDENRIGDGRVVLGKCAECSCYLFVAHAKAPTEPLVGYVLWDVEKRRPSGNAIYATKQKARGHRDLYCPPLRKYEIRGIILAPEIPDE